jgi:hypothetical protein
MLGNFLSSCGTGSFSRRAQLHEVSWLFLSCYAPVPAVRVRIHTEGTCVQLQPTLSGNRRKLGPRRRAYFGIPLRVSKVSTCNRTMVRSKQLEAVPCYHFETCSDAKARHILWGRSRTMALGSTQPLTEMSTRNLLRGKWRPARKADNLTAICESFF